MIATAESGAPALTTAARGSRGSGPLDLPCACSEDEDRPTGWLAWAFHSDFSAYVGRLADGRIEVTGGTRRTESGRFLFPEESNGPQAPVGPDGHGLLPEGFGPAAGELRWAGAAHFTGHHGLLAVTLAGLAIRITEGAHGGVGGVLTMADPFAPGSRMTLAELGTGEPAPDGLRFPAPTLTEEGADLFFGHYREGLVLAPLEVLPGDPPPQDLPAAPARSSDPQESR